MINNSGIPKELHRNINQELQPGEVIRWIGQPVMPEPVDKIFRFIANRGIWVIILWNLFTFFGPFSIFGPWSITRGENVFQGDSIRLQFFLFELFLFVVATVISLLVIRRLQAYLKTVYLVTNQRAILMDGRESVKTKSYLPNQFSNISYEKTADNIGSIKIKLRSWQSNHGKRENEELVFAGVYNPTEVVNILKQL